MSLLPKRLVQAGIDIANYLTNAQCENSMTRLGGCREFTLKNYPSEYHDLITAYLNDEIESVEAIYIAMERARNT